MDQTAQHMMLFFSSHEYLLNDLSHRELQMTKEEFEQRCNDFEEESFFEKVSERRQTSISIKNN